MVHEYGDRLREARSQLGWSQAQVARQMWPFQWRVNTVSRVELGERRLELAEGVTLCRLLNYPLEALFDSPPPATPPAALRERVHTWTGTVWYRFTCPYCGKLDQHARRPDGRLIELEVEAPCGGGTYVLTDPWTIEGDL